MKLLNDLIYVTKITGLLTLIMVFGSLIITFIQIIIENTLKHKERVKFIKQINPKIKELFNLKKDSD